MPPRRVAFRRGDAVFDKLIHRNSATCVTGLIRVDTGTHWAMFGQVVILLLIQVGGLGFMTIACLFFFAASPEDRSAGTHGSGAGAWQRQL